MPGVNVNSQISTVLLMSVVNVKSQMSKAYIMSVINQSADVYNSTDIGG
jgi:hypothetical protein